MRSFRVHTVVHAGMEEAMLTFTNLTNNPTESFKIVRLGIDPFYPSIGGQGKINLVRVTSPTLQEADTNDRITPNKHNPAASDLPSQVIISKNASLAGTQLIYRCYLPQPIFGTQGSANALGFKAVGKLVIGSGMESSANLYAGMKGSVVDPIIISDGESFMLAPKDETLQYPNTYFIHVVLKVTGGGTFSIMEEFTPSRGVTGQATDSGFVIHNGSGSGVNIEIREMDLYDFGQSTILATGDVPQLRIVRSDSVYGGGQAVPITQHNAAYPVPAALSVKRNTVAYPLTINPVSKTGINIYQDFAFPGNTANYPFVRKTNLLRTTLPGLMPLAGPGVNNFFGPMLDNDVSYGFQSRSSQVDGFYFNMNETIAILASNVSAYAKYRIGATIIHQPPQQSFYGHS